MSVYWHKITCMRPLLLATFVFLGLFNSKAQDPVVQSLLDVVEIDSLIYFASAISGEFAIDVNGNAETISSRNKSNPGNAICADYIEQKFNEYGLTTSIQSFGPVGENVLGVKLGAVNPDQKVIICGHYDSMPTGAVSPAADDDGSGTAALIEAARVFSQYNFVYTIVFAAWDEEEYGLVGANYYASQAATANEAIVGVINIDAIAWDGNGDGLARIHTRPIAASENLATIAQSMNTEYNIGLNLAINNPGATYSDHAAFWNNDFSAILIIEDFDDDGNPHYHTTTDRVEYFDTTYYGQIAKLSFATAATVAIPYTGNVAVDELKEDAITVYPNPAFDAIIISGVVTNGGNHTFQLFDLDGRLVLQEQSTASEIMVSLDGLSSGSYMMNLLDATGVVRFSQSIVKE